MLEIGGDGGAAGEHSSGVGEHVAEGGDPALERGDQDAGRVAARGEVHPVDVHVAFD